MGRRKLRVTQIRNDKRVTFLTPDKGELGRTPKSKRWYKPGMETGWEKSQPEAERRVKVLNAHGGDELASGRSMQALVNVTTDRETAQKARSDAKYFFRIHREIKGVSRRRRGKAPKKATGLTRLQRIHSKRSPQSQAADERQGHQVLLRPDSPLAKRWAKDPGSADVRGIDTPQARKKTPRITPKTPRLKR